MSLSNKTELANSINFWGIETQFNQLDEILKHFLDMWEKFLTKIVFCQLQKSRWQQRDKKKRQNHFLIFVKFFKSTYNL